eukprot:TRINITY_DN731_c2_g1_i1.p1 TRINITY_DN731_c2_g1~~TRINITY_DN731_c2_g1_i1.p1  ORF type:complete len:337 (+),score=135.60 TRINITY_DN731_c2_g1_i1:36-1013(+)
MAGRHSGTAAAPPSPSSSSLPDEHPGAEGRGAGALSSSASPSTASTPPRAPPSPASSVSASVSASSSASSSSSSYLAHTAGVGFAAAVQRGGGGARGVPQALQGEQEEEEKEEGKEGEEEEKKAEEPAEQEFEEVVVVDKKAHPVYRPERSQLSSYFVNNPSIAFEASLAALLLDEMIKYRQSKALLKVLQSLPEFEEPPAEGKKRKREEEEDAHSQTHCKVSKTVTTEELVDCAGLRPLLYLDKPSPLQGGKFARSEVVDVADVMNALLSISPESTYDELLKLAGLGLDEKKHPCRAYRRSFVKQTSEVKTELLEPRPEFFELL